MPRAMPVGLHIKQLRHQSNDIRLADCLTGTYRQRSVVVSGRGQFRGNELFPRHGGEYIEDTLIPDAPCFQVMLGHELPLPVEIYPFFHVWIAVTRSILKNLIVSRTGRILLRSCRYTVFTITGLILYPLHDALSRNSVSMSKWEVVVRIDESASLLMRRYPF